VREGFEIVRSVNRPNVKVLYDFYHEQRGGGNLIEKLEKNIDWVGLVHIADVPGRHEPGTGEIDYTNIYRCLGKLHYGHFIAMEYAPTTDPVVSLRKSRMEAQEGYAEGQRAV
jgi:hydroxypyruvate isomerase